MGDTISGESEQPCARLPFNSKHLTTQQLKRVAVALGVPTSASTEELRQMLKGKLTELRKEPRNVQVVIVGDAEMYLCDEGGKFLDILISEDPPSSEEQDSVSDDGESGSEDLVSLQTALAAAQVEVTSLQEQVSTLKMEVCHEKAHIKEMWRGNCEYTTEVDKELAEKDAEIADLKERPSRTSERVEPSTRVSDIYQLNPMYQLPHL